MTLKIFIPGRIITRQLDCSRSEFKKRKGEMIKVVSIISDRRGSEQMSLLRVRPKYEKLCMDEWAGGCKFGTMCRRW